MKNIDIRQLMSTSRVKYYEVASSLGIAETSFSRMMRKELSNEQKEKRNKSF